MMMRSSRSSHLHPACRTEKKTNTTTTMTTHTKFHAKFERRSRPQEKREAVGSTSTTQRGETRHDDAGDDMGDESAPARSLLTRLCLSFVFALHTQADLVLYAPRPRLASNMTSLPGRKARAKKPQHPKILGSRKKESQGELASS